MKLCTLCRPLVETRTQIVYGGKKKLTANTKLFIIGEAPGRKEDKEGHAFIGKAGKLLESIFVDIKELMPFNNYFITNVVACRPPNNRNPKVVEMENCRPRLLRQVDFGNPRVIVTLGKYATCGVLGLDPELTPLKQFTYYKKKNKDGDIEERIHEKAAFAGRDNRKIPVYASYHPAFVLRQGGDERKRYRSHIMKTIVAAQERITKERR